MPRADDELKRTHDESIAAGQRTEENSGQDGKLQIPSSSKKAQCKIRQRTFVKAFAALVKRC